MKTNKVKTIRAAESVKLDPDIGTILGQLRARAPLVHCLGNSPAKALMANAVLALGASPAMVADTEEVA
ncbi:MAG: hydroxyethylthiazole kinase, partial [Candidatus Accumulibacter sp.]|nr:hydroxyethylthiazole kinase [Accumulibacter sp.]